MRNQYKGICYVCGKIVEPYRGFFERDCKKKLWKVKHYNCVPRHKNMTDPLLKKYPHTRPSSEL